MNTNTEITTAARRIAREHNARNGSSVDFKLYFDRSGSLVDVLEKGMAYANRADYAEFAVMTVSGQGVHMTYRAAQDLLDAYDAHGKDYYAQDFYLYELRNARDSERFA